MLFETAAAKTVAAAVLAGGATLGVNAAVTDCPAGQEMTVVGCAKVTHYPDELKDGDTGIISAPSVSVAFRDESGNRTGSGMSKWDQFKWLGGKKPGKNGDGTLIEVEQITKGKGGWGSRYRGWIPVKYTQAPEQYKG